MARQHSYTGPPLTANANQTIIGPFPTENGQKITGYVFADQGGTVYVEQSADQTNWDISDQFTLTASTALKIDTDVIVAYVRIRVVNGGTNQGTIRAYLRTLSPQGF